MHEMGIAESVLHAVRKQIATCAGARPLKVGLKIGELAGVDPEALRFCFEVMARGTELESLQLEIEFCPRRQRCGECGNEFAVTNYEFKCPQCGCERGDCAGGDELDIAYVEGEEHATSGVGSEGT